MSEHTIDRINLFSFLAALSTIAAGVALAIADVWTAGWDVNPFVWKLLATDALVFAGAVLTNLAIACYRKPGGAIA